MRRVLFLTLDTAPPGPKTRKLGWEQIVSQNEEPPGPYTTLKNGREQSDTRIYRIIRHKLDPGEHIVPLTRKLVPN